MTLSNRHCFSCSMNRYEPSVPPWSNFRRERTYCAFSGNIGGRSHFATSLRLGNNDLLTVNNTHFLAFIDFTFLLHIYL